MGAGAAEANAKLRAAVAAKVNKRRAAGWSAALPKQKAQSGFYSKILIVSFPSSTLRSVSLQVTVSSIGPINSESIR